MTRINVYAEEITDEVQIVTKVVSDEKFGDRKFYGLRFYLKSAPELHSDPTDNDRSAITLWIPWTRKGGYNTFIVRNLLKNLQTQLRFIQQRVAE